MGDGGETGEEGGLGRPGFTKFTRRAASVVGMLVAIAILAWFVWEMITFILVLFLAILFAIFLRGWSLFLSKKTGLGDHGSLFVVVIALVLISGLSGLFIVPAIAEQVDRIRELAPQAVQEVELWVAETPIARDVLVELGEVDIGQFLDSALIGQVGGAFAGIVGVLSHIAFIVAVGIYLAFDPEPYKRGLIKMVPLHYRKRTKEIIDICNHQLAWWLIGRLVSMLAVAVIVTIGLWILGVPLAITLGLIAGLFSFVPILGPIVSVVPALLVALLVSPLHIIWVMLLYMGAQAIEGYLITPVVQYRVVALPHAITLIAEIFGGVLFGLIGVTVATPMAVLLMALINMIYIEDILGDRTSYTDLSAEIHEF